MELTTFLLCAILALVSIPILLRLIEYTFLLGLMAADEFDIHPLAIMVLMVCIVALFFSIFWHAIGGRF